MAGNSLRFVDFMRRLCWNGVDVGTHMCATWSYLSVVLFSDFVCCHCTVNGIFYGSWYHLSTLILEKAKVQRSWPL